MIMNGFMCGFCATILSAMLWPLLPQLSMLPLFLVAALVLFRHTPVLAGMLIALSWITAFNALLTSTAVSEDGNPVTIKAEIIALVYSNRDWISVDVALIEPTFPSLLTSKLRLSWSKPPSLAVGQQWQLTIKPKPITSVVNQGSFNQQKSLLSKHILAKGNVLEAQLISTSPELRTQLIKQLTPALASFPSQDLLLALLVGDKQLMSQSRWLQLRRTGTGHLFAISGLHLSVACFWAYLLSSRVLFNFAAHQGRRNRIIAMICCSLIVIGYAYLAGFSVSTQRALIMLLTYFSTWIFRRYSSSWERLLYALFVVLLLDPFSPLSAGFWLSFMALVVILVSMSTWDRTFEGNDASQVNEPVVEPKQPLQLKFSQWRQTFVGWLWAFWAIQWRLALVLGVVQAVFFAGSSLISVLINLVLVPWFSFVVIPLSLLSLFLFVLVVLVGFHGDGAGIFWLADKTMEPVLWLLEHTSGLTFAWFALTEQSIAVLLYALLGVGLCCSFKLGYWRIACSVMLLPLLALCFQVSTDQQSPRWQVHMLDVGQGMSVVIESNRRAVVYDTGASFGDFSYAERVVVPFLQHRGIKHVDYLVISHKDNDHAGGAQVVLNAYPDAQVIADDKLAALTCRPKTFLWQTITIAIIAPKFASKGNNGSCVLRVSQHDQSILLTGDIEAKAELQLSTQANIASNIMSVPHHGSNTSSSLAFIQAASPQLVLIPAGFNNRYGFPKKAVLERYHQLGISVLTTGEQGQLSVTFEPESIEYDTYRSNIAPFWYNQIFRFGPSANPE